MKHPLVILATLAGLAIGSPAVAADMPVKAPIAPMPAFYDWTGAYIGGQLGYLWGAARVEDNGVITDDHALINGAIGGVVAGFNWQNGRLVLGFDGDYGFSNARGNGQVADETQIFNRINSTYHIRGRIGAAMDNNLLIFFAGGLAAADFRFPPAETMQYKGGYFDGASFGGGFEYGILPQLSGRVEVIYDDFGSKSYVTSYDLYRVHLTGRTVRGALTFKFWTGR
jgi:opacity protein-like surface antigen